jgi:alkanesulfonate monooxygenase
MQLLCAISESSWQGSIASLTLPDNNNADPYWLVPFRNYHTYCPYLVGSYDEVGEAVRKYLSGGVRGFILDEPHELADLHHARTAIERAVSAHNNAALMNATAAPRPDLDRYARPAAQPGPDPRLPM